MGKYWHLSPCYGLYFCNFNKYQFTILNSSTSSLLKLFWKHLTNFKRHKCGPICAQFFLSLYSITLLLLSRYPCNQLWRVWFHLIGIPYDPEGNIISIFHGCLLYNHPCKVCLEWRASASACTTCSHMIPIENFLPIPTHHKPLNYNCALGQYYWSALNNNIWMLQL